MDSGSLALLIMGIITSGYLVITGIMAFYFYWQIGKVEKEILKKTREKNILAIQAKKHKSTPYGPMSFASLLDERYPKSEMNNDLLASEIEILKMKRQFMIDKIPFLSFFKK